MNQGSSEQETAQRKENLRRKALSAGASALAVLAIGGAGLAVWNSRGVSRAERIAAKGGPEMRQQASRGANRGGQGGRRGGFGGPGGGEDFGQRREQRTAQMAADLGLSTDQQAQIKKLGESMRPQMQALWQNQSLSRDDKRTQMQALRTQMQTQMRALMTPEQQQRFDAMQQQRQARRQELRQRREQTRAAVIASGQTPPERGGRGGRTR